MPADFYRLLRQAYAGDLVEPLLHYIDHTGLADAGERREFLQWVRHLLGRSMGPRWPLPNPEIERRMARFVKVMQAEWRRQHVHQRVPASETTRMIATVVNDTAGEMFGVAPERISAANIRRELKTGRIRPLALP